MRKRNIVSGLAIAASMAVIAPLANSSASAVAPTAPVVTGNPTPYDFSEEAKKNFFAWWAFEQNYMLPSSLLAEEAYTKSITVCAEVWRGGGLSGIEEWLEDTVGETATNAAALIAASLRSTCPSLNQTAGQGVSCNNFAGYLTYFDKQLQIWHTRFNAETTFLTGAIVYNLCGFGGLGKFICTQLLKPNGGNELNQALYTHPEYRTTIGIYHIDDYKRIVRYAFEATCPAATLGYWWSLPGF